MSQPYKQCPQCQATSAIAAQVCPNCGHIYRTQFAPQPTQQFQSPRVFGTHSVFAAILFSLIFPGGGQYYNGQIAKSWCLFLATPVLFAVGVAGMMLAGRVAPENPLSILTGGAALIAWVLIPILWVTQLLDAAFVAGHIQHGHTVKPWDWF